MWVEIVVVAVVLSIAVGVVSRVLSARRGTDPRTGPAPDEQSPGAWTAAGPLDAAFPVERTPRERNIGDAAFVDGFVVGHYIAPLRKDEDRDPVQPAHGDLVPDGDDVSTAGAWESFAATPSDEPDDQAADELDLDADAGYGHGGYVSSWDGSQDDPDDDTSEDGFDDGFDDGFGIEDGLDDDW